MTLSVLSLRQCSPSWSICSRMTFIHSHPASIIRLYRFHSTLRPTLQSSRHHAPLTVTSIRHFAQPVPQKKKASVDDGESVLLKVLEGDKHQQVAKTTAQKVKQAGTDLTYIVLALGAAGCVALLAYYLASEMLTPNSPQRVFSRALDEVRQNDQVQNLFGTPISGFGEETRRGRRRHTTHVEYEKDGEKRMRMLFYVKGPLAQGAANLEMKMDETGHYVFRYLFVETEDVPHRTILLIDNR